jgi:hypothetical protein
MNTFAAYCDRDDLNVCKRALENGDGTNWKLEASLKYRPCRRGRYAQGKLVTPMSRLAPRGGRRLHAWGQLLPRFLKTPLIARRVHNIFAAPPPRANTGSVDPATAIAIAARVKNNFGEFFMSRVLARIENGLFP